MEELNLTQTSNVSTKPALVVVEEEPHFRIALEGDKNFVAMKEQILDHFSNDNPEQIKKEMELFSDVWDIDKLEMLETPKCGNCGAIASQRCSKCKTEW